MGMLPEELRKRQQEINQEIRQKIEQRQIQQKDRYIHPYAPEEQLEQIKIGKKYLKLDNVRQQIEAHMPNAYTEINRLYAEQDEYKAIYGDDWSDLYQLDISNYATQLQSAFGLHGSDANIEAWNQMIEKYTDEVTFEVDWYKVVNSEEFANVMAGVDRQIDNVAKKQAAYWQKLNPIAGAWVQTTDAYIAAEESTQDLLSKIIGNLDYSKIGIANEGKLKKYLTTTFIDPITNAAPEVQNAMAGLFDIKSAFESGALTVGEYGVVDYILGDLKDAGVSDTILSALSEDSRAQIEALAEELCRS